MPNPNGNPNLHGNKNSGRKSAKEEHIKSLVMMKAWGKLLKKYRNMKDDEIEKLCLPVVLRNIPQDVKANIEVKYQPIYGGKSIQGHESDTEDIQPDKENKSD